MKQNTLTRAATLAPTSWDAETRTVEVNFSTFADVNRFDAKGPFIERLDPNGLDLSKFVGASVLNAHRQSGLGDVLGIVLKATKAGIAKLQLSAREDAAPFVADIAAGIIRHLSIGYAVQQWRESIDPKSGARIKTAARWSPRELSFVPVPADFGATTRSDPVKKKNVGADPALDETDVPGNDNVENVYVTRNAAIRTLCRTNKLPRDFEDSLIDGEGGMIEARAAVEAELMRRTPTIRTAASVGFSNEDPAVIRERRVEARFVRDNGGQMSDAARPYANESLLDWAKDALHRSGVSTVGMGADDIFTRAATHGTSDFPEHLTGVGRRVALAAYTVAPAPLKTIARQSSFSDFRAKLLLRASGLGLLEEVGEHGEITGTTRYESKESYSGRTFARMMGTSRKSVLNDDLGLFNEQARMFGIAASQTEAAELVALLESNPVLDDNVALFDASRGNVDASNTPISVESLSAARLAMRLLTDDDGTLISVTPKYIVVSAELETAAQVFLAAIQPAQIGDANPFTALVPIVEPRLAAFTWYLAADPAQAPVLEYAHLSGASGPVVESRATWTTLGFETRAYLDFGCGVVGSKGLFKFASGEDSNSAVF